MADEFAEGIANQIQQLSPKGQQDLEEFVNQQQNQADFHEKTSALTEKCFELCVPKPGNSLSSAEETCLKNCVNRFIDTSLFILQKVQDSS